MTTSNLVDELAGVVTVGEQKFRFTDSQVKFWGSFAQNDILTKLKIVEQTVRLALVDGQEKYTFTPATPTSIAQAVNGEVVLTFSSHPFHEGDEVVVAGVGTGADGRWYITTPSTTSIQLTGSTTVPTLGASPKVYHGLQAAIEINDENGIRKISTASGSLTGALVKRSRAVFERDRQLFGTADTNFKVNEPSVRYFMEEFTAPCLTIHVQGTPAIDILTEVTFKRRPLPCEVLSDTVDPFLPSEYDEPLLNGTKAFMYSQRDEAGMEKMAGKYMTLYVSKLEEIRQEVARRRVVFTSPDPSTVW